ncbi:hypothetical protein WJX72_006683 [[Myrmecia] bisecta]|uniref:Uncharacterized protein n=1 Tax=[Myrmecia] bisecta TaxID=41462 RepID=A0AAW1R7G3_9CHLO
MDESRLSVVWKSCILPQSITAEEVRNVLTDRSLVKRRYTDPRSWEDIPDDITVVDNTGIISTSRLTVQDIEAARSREHDADEEFEMESCVIEGTTLPVYLDGVLAKVQGVIRTSQRHGIAAKDAGKVAVPLSTARASSGFDRYYNPLLINNSLENDFTPPQVVGDGHSFEVVWAVWQIREFGEEGQGHQAAPCRGQRAARVAGRSALGHTVRVVDAGDRPVAGRMQWMRSRAGSGWHAISGAIRNQYRPEPLDVGWRLRCRLQAGEGEGHPDFASIAMPVAAGPKMFQLGRGEFGVVVVQMNGVQQANKAVCQLEVGRDELVLKQQGRVQLREPYRQTMQVCGARGAGDAAAQGMFLAIAADQVFMLACESARERNACIMLIRQMAAAHSLLLAGPEDAT